MDSFIFALNIIAPYFIVLAIGYSMKKTPFGKDTFLSAANSFVFRVALPIKLFLNVHNIDTIDVIKPKLFIYTAVSILAAAGLSTVFYNYFTNDNKARGALVQATIRSNYIIYGTSIAAAIYGAEGAANASMLTVITVPLFNVLAVLILELYRDGSNKQCNLKKIIVSIAKNPLIFSIILGYFVNTLDLRLPSFLFTALNDIGACAMPIALLVLGAQFSFACLSKNYRNIAAGTIGKLVIVPAIVLSAAIWLGFRNMDLILLMLIFASPAAVACYVMAVEAESDGELTGQLVVSTSLFSTFTLFLILFLLRTYGLV